MSVTASADGAEALIEPAPSGEGVSVADIRAAYRIFLHREADPGGLRHFTERVASGGFGFDDLVSGLTDSEEYRNKHARSVVTVNVDGVSVVVDPEEPEFGRVIARDGVWEPHIIQAIRSNLKPGDVVVDVGANVGIMSFQAASMIGPAGRVFAFEPNQDNVQRLLQGILINGFENVTLYPFAASDAPAIFSMQGHSNTYLVKASIGGRLTQSVRVDDILKDEARIDFVKMDIEGHEPLALAGLAGLLRQHRPMVLCEFNPRCLRSNVGMEPSALAEQIFTFTDRVELVEHDCSRTPCASAAELMYLWERRNRALVAAGELDDGLLHFDLLFRVTKPGY